VKTGIIDNLPELTSAREVTDNATFGAFLSLAMPGFVQFGIPLTANIICAIEQEVELER
jgi:hypothetical protein